MLDDSRIRVDAAYWDHLRRVVDLTERLHQVPKDWRPVPLVPLRLLNRRGAYFHGSGPRPYSTIEFSEAGDDQAMTTLHEVGHLIDHQLVGEPGIWATSAPLHTALIEWDRAIRGSECWNLLVDLRTRPLAHPIFGTITRDDQEQLDYLLDRRELFARSYLQWATLRSADEVLEACFADLPTPSRTYGDFPEQWDSDDFQTIASSLDELFAATNRTNP